VTLARPWARRRLASSSQAIAVVALAVAASVLVGVATVGAQEDVPNSAASDVVAVRIASAEAALDVGDRKAARQHIRGLHRADVKDANLRRRLNAVQRTVFDDHPWPGSKVDPSTRGVSPGAHEARLVPPNKESTAAAEDPGGMKYSVLCFLFVSLMILVAFIKIVVKLPWRCTYCGVSNSARATRHQWRVKGKSHTLCSNCNRRMRGKVSKDAWRS
jgi:hypothetical protein